MTKEKFNKNLRRSTAEFRRRGQNPNCDTLDMVMSGWILEGTHRCAAVRRLLH